MVDILLVFEVHQPFRLRRDFFWGKREYRKIGKNELLDHYFDLTTDAEIFKRAARKCYLPSNDIILKLIDENRHGSKDVKVTFSISGVFLDQCERFEGDVLEGFKQLAETGRVEFLGQTYYHSLSSLYPSKDEFVAQVEEHRNKVKDLLGYVPKVFENTELIYNNGIAKSVELLGFRGMCTEGAERVIGYGSPNQILEAKGCEGLRVILRNYKLSDDIGFRFSNKSWSEWPLTAEKYASWLALTKGQYVCIFLDYETFGEHHWPETGIHDFLRKLPEEILGREELVLSTPSKVLTDYKPVGVLDVPESQTVSWADIERSTHSWIGNDMQWAFYSEVRDVEGLVKETDDEELMRLWRYFQISDHLYYMFTSGGGPGAVHSYFSPYEKPIDAFINAQVAFMDFEQRLRLNAFAANEPFRFQTADGDEGYIGLSSLSLLGFYSCLSKIPLRSIEFHQSRGDFEVWIEKSLRDAELADKVRQVSASGEELRLKLKRAVWSRIDQLRNNFRKMGYS